MAALDSPTYQDLLNLAARLEPGDQLRLLEALAASVRQQIEAPRRYSVTTLRGLGALFLVPERKPG